MQPVVERLYKTTDGGATWYIVYFSSEEFIRAITFANDSKGYAVGYDGTILKTTNAGDNWIPIQIGTSDDFYSVFFTKL